MKSTLILIATLVMSGCVSREKYFHDLKIMALDEANFRDRVGELEKRVREIERKVDLDAENREQRSNRYQKAAEEAGKRTDEKLIERNVDRNTQKYNEWGNESYEKFMERWKRGEAYK